MPADTIDEDLVDSIVVPATDPAAAEVFYRINSSKAPSKSVNQLLKQMRGSKLPLLLLWGDLDPWITPKRVSGMDDYYTVCIAVSSVGVKPLNQLVGSVVLSDVQRVGAYSASWGISMVVIAVKQFYHGIAAAVRCSQPQITPKRVRGSQVSALLHHFSWLEPFGSHHLSALK